MSIGRIAPRTAAALAAATLALAVTACGSFQSATRGVDEAQPLTEASMARSWERGLRLLARGDEDMAEAEFVLARESAEFEERARRMLRQIRTPPTRYFPADYFHVELSQGQSLSSLAERYLGEPLEFYALARYNAIRTPASVALGQQIRIPLTEHAARVRRAETGSPDTDDPITDPEPRTGAADEPAADSAAGTEPEEAQGDAAAGAEAPASAGQGPDGPAEGASVEQRLSPRERRERIARHYRNATQAFQRQDLEGTIRHCEQVLALDPDHENCQLYRARARELKRRLADIPESG